MANWLRPVVVVVMTGLLMTGPALGQEKRGSVAPTEVRKQATELQAETDRLDARAKTVTATSPGNARVITRIADDFDVPESVVRGLRAQGLGFGGVTIVLALAQQLSGPDLPLNDAIAQIMSERRAGAGWGQIAHNHELKLGPVLSAVKRSDKSLAGLERAAGRHASALRLDERDRGDRPQKIERVARREKPEKVERLNRRH